MFVHNLNPILINIGPVEIRYYGIFFVIAFLIVYYYLIKKKEELNLTKDEIESFVFYIILGTVIGARIFAIVFWNPSYYIDNPLEIFAVWKGGLSLHGGILGVVIVCYYFSKKYDIKLAKIADILVVPALLGLALGRVANFINGELIGTITNVEWCVVFPNVKGCRHPVQLYGSAGRFLLFGYLVWLKKIKKWKDGFLFWNFILFMGIGRFLTDFLREDARWLGLSTGQYLSIVMAAIAGYALWKYYRK